MEQPLVSVICNAYKQEAYIGEALESFLMQKTDFPVEILVHDDASPDGTASVIRRYAEQYPDRIFPILQTENQTRKGAKITLEIQAPRARGKYIAFCEGDDYWTDPMKLARQAALLEANPGTDLCAHAAYEVQADTKQILGKTAPAETACTLTTEQAILGGGEYLATNSLLFRAEILREPSRELSFLSLDYTMQIMGSLAGGILYLPEVMSAHRFAAKASWSAKAKRDPAVRLDMNRRIGKMLTMLDEDTDGKYADAIRERRRVMEAQDLYASGSFRELKQPRFRDIYRGYTLKEKLFINLNVYAPHLMRFRESRKTKDGAEG